MTDTDIIIAGGGVAGLSLAYHLVQSPLRDQSILIIDRTRKLRNDCTLSYWASEPTPFDALACRSWDRLRVAGDRLEDVMDLGPYRYHVMRGVDFYDGMRWELAGFPNVNWRKGAISRIEDGPQGATVWLSDGTAITARWVFDSRFTPAQVDGSRCRATQQYFLGWEIETDTDAFDPETPIFMDFRTAQADGVCFNYVLPFSARRALVEHVRMGGAPGGQDRLLRHYIRDVLGISDYRVVAKEGGAIPLTNWRFARKAGAHVMAIGTCGGRVKPSSGYAFTRIQRDSAAIVASLVANGHPFDVPADPAFFRMCDSLMLRALDACPRWMVPLFEALFGRNPARRIFAFLDETASPLQTARLTTSLLPALAAQVGATVALPRRRTRHTAEGRAVERRSSVT